MSNDVGISKTDRGRPVQTRAEHETVGAAAIAAKMNGVDTRPEESFIDQLPDARRSICHRLVGGLLRGHPDGLQTYSILSIDDPSLSSTAHSRLRTIGADELLQRIQPLPERCQHVAFLPFPASNVILAAPIEAVYGYDRFHLTGPVALLNPEDTVYDPHPVDLVSLFQREGMVPNEQQADRIADELAESVANLAFARLVAQSKAGGGPNSTADHGSVFDLLDELPGADPASALERLAIEGHPFHPGAKIRRGMTPAESLLYAPEFTETIDVRFVAVTAEETLQARTGSTLTDLLYDRFPGLETAVDHAVPTEYASEDYAVIPIHPWQYYQVIHERYAKQIAQHRVIPLQEYTWPATPLLNLRTVVPYPVDSDSPPLLHLKLAVDVQLTNVVRTVSPQAVYNGPQVTDLLTTILELESFETFGILSEPAATCYHAPGGPHPNGDEFDNARNLSGLVRMNPYSHPLVSDDALPVAVASLLATSPVTDRPIICDVLDRFVTNEATAGTPKAFFEAYVDVMVPEQLHLLSKYGIALESHPQNSSVVFTDGQPMATLIRDLGGIRVLDERLVQHDLTLDAYPDSDLGADDPRDLYNKLYYALFQNQFTELIATLTEHTPLDESYCWNYVRARCRETFDALRSDAAVPTERVDHDERALFEDPTLHKALTAMRLQGKRHEYVTSWVSNPLAR